jgi:hypothetical protein
MRLISTYKNNNYRIIPVIFVYNNKYALIIDIYFYEYFL